MEKYAIAEGIPENTENQEDIVRKYLLLLEKHEQLEQASIATRTAIDQHHEELQKDPEVHGKAISNLRTELHESEMGTQVVQKEMDALFKLMTSETKQTYLA